MIKFGIVGLGRLGASHAKNMRYNIPGVTLNAICAINQTELDSYKEKLDVKNGYLTFEEMVNSNTIDAVVICSPSEYHVEHIELALKAGLHVFSEKPIALSVEDAERVSYKIKEYPNQIFMLGFMRRFDPGYLKAKQLIDEGFIGTPYFFRGYGLDPNDAIEGFLQFARNADSGGIFMDLSIHDFDLARWYLGVEASEVWSIGGSYRYPEIDELGDAEVAAAMMRFEENKMAFFLASRSCVHGYHVEAEIIGTKGVLQIGKDPVESNVVVLNETGIVQDVSKGFADRFKEAYLEELIYFCECIKTNTQPSITEEDGVLSIKMAHATRKAFTTNTIQKI